jgi:hypothetical protein
MKYKADWSDAQKRLTALWHGEMIDRPCISVKAHQPVDNASPVPTPKNEEARWLDPDYLIPHFQNHLENTWWGGEAVPSVLLMSGWVNCLGGTPRFSPETIWFDPQDVDFSKPSPFRHDPYNPWTRKHRAAHIALCRLAGRDDFLVGQASGLPANDLLSMHMGAESFLIALMDHPDWMLNAITNGCRDQIKLKQELADLTRTYNDYWYGCPGWMPFWAPEPFVCTQSDVSCMMSPELYGRFILPELDLLAQATGNIWYHLDGGDARQHLPRLLSLPYLRVIQYTPTPNEPPNGPGHLDMYRAIQAAGKIFHVDLPSQNIEPLVRELDPSRMMLSTYCSSREEGEKLLEQSIQWANHPVPSRLTIKRASHGATTNRKG